MVGMSQRMLILLFAALLTLSGSWTEAQRQTSALQSGPFFVWSDQPYIAADKHGSASRAWYETASVRGVTKQVLGSLSGGGVKEDAQNLLNATHLQQLAPRTVVAFLGSHIPRSGDVTAQQGLQSFLDAAASSLALPNVLHKAAPGTSSEMLSVLRTEHTADRVQTLGACEGMEGYEEASAEAFKALHEGQQGASEAKVVVVCSSEGTAQAELQLLREIENTLKESAVPHVMVYATQPSAAYPSPTRRSLLAAKQQQPQFVCDATCQTQVKLIEGVILAINLIAAIWIGSWMMHGLGTPTRFETPKEGVQRD